MIEETGTSGYDCTEEAPMTELTSRTVRRSRSSGDDDDDVTISGTGKRRRFDSRREIDVKFHEHDVMRSINTDSISDLKAECVSETDNLISGNDDFSRETSTSSVVCLESEEMESLSASNKKKMTRMTEVTSPAVMMPSAAELEDFFSKAEKYEQKRFAEKYNFDIVKDVPMEGRYQWVPLKP